MNVDCFYCLRYLLMFIIFLNMVLGLSLLGASLWIFLHGAKMGQVLAETEGVNYILYFLMALGAIKFLLGFLGCYGVSRKNSKILATFFALVLIVFLGQIAAGVWLYIGKDQVTESAEHSLASFIKQDYGEKGFEAKTKALDVLQSKFKCCGSGAPADWSKSIYNEANETYVLEDYLVPTSCCMTNDTTICEEARLVSHEILEDSIYKNGCINRIWAQIFEYEGEIFGVVGGIILIELFVMTSTLTLCRSTNVRYQL
ncbi:hypothetical protein SK128_001567 [Halocaridina rubra]|uniref:Tetraspanin n=1 Tax=Halocaridina rubra TaxID=373956 RepID=A0AAN8ZVQ9_HALRR